MDVDPIRGAMGAIESIETPVDEAADMTISCSARLMIHGDDENLSGHLTVEYKPRRHRVDDREVARFVAGFDDFDADPSKIAFDVYTALAEALYPNESYLEEPWETLPLVVTLTYGYQEDGEDPMFSERKNTVVIGGYNA